MVRKEPSAVDWEDLFVQFPAARAVDSAANCTIFRQGDVADTLFLLKRGKVKLSVTSSQGKEAIISMLGSNHFLGEGCLAGQSLRMSTATALTDCSLVSLDKRMMMGIPHERHEISEMFVNHLLSRNIRYEADLVDQLFNSSEKRPARIRCRASIIPWISPLLATLSWGESVGGRRGRGGLCGR